MISIIIPVYNTEKYLERCINSVLDSTYENFEILLVDDGSNDRSLEICRNYSDRDSRIRVFMQKSRGGYPRQETEGLRKVSASGLFL